MSASNSSNTPDAPPRRRKRKDYSLLVLAAGIFLFGVAAGGLYYILRPVTLRIAVGPPGSDDQRLVQALAQTFARDGGPVRLTPITTEGAIESIALLAAKKADLAVARGDLDLPADAQSVAILRKNVVVLWSVPGLPARGTKKPPAPRIKELGDLAGHRVGVIGRTQANVALLRVILTESGVNADKVAITQFRTDQVAEMARDPAIEAFMAVGPLDSKITIEAIAATAKARGEPKFLPIEVSETISKKHPRYDTEEIPGSTFSPSPARPADKLDTVSVSHLIVAPKSLSEITAGAFVRQLFAVRQTLAREMPAAAKIEQPDTDKDAAVPAHAGASAYIDGNERTFLERYSDFFWGALLALSGLGSAGAWLRHYLNRDEREQYSEHRDDLLAIISKVRLAQSLDELTAMQNEVDGVLRETLDCYDDGAIEEGDLAAIGLVLDQFNHAIADRRVAIGLVAPEPARMRAL
ncbi:MAG: TAXI family TRAP transporter solute-binding subunit [Bradyrhizobium sp.]|uniref:TAXI family TRAP transporter solute-binding subunit n=1 Tax=Bradyrhizobium sp. TaxID=376 RepID=UPI0027194CCF|nr:TAXI family TRAP transporter solute-binding subunit [Bradyrhizobium sp.]MDO9059784.1 TAXI family TRAP transporter solute-binding subunit [Bradyrhizobium sp.]MDO9562719.1 TAXI family TRAP transporter solute-binding subunit [Bradyrhizobium sp.]MDP3694175.1 TAXI family TRAP transporter solute-binding subunit [Bradyrhizobium sp.]